MGADIGDLLEKREVEVRELAGEVLAVDAFNTIYQFLSIIRQRDGTPLLDSKGEITSHLSGFLYRTVNLVEAGVKPVFVFDGNPPSFKSDVLEERARVREEAGRLWEEALATGRMEDAFKYAQAASTLDSSIVEGAKRLLELMGMPVVQAPSEGEAQAAFMVMQGDASAAASQDYDSLLFGAPRVARNLAVSGKRKLPGKKVYVDVKPQIVELETSLTRLNITRSQLVDISILVGTDYNQGIPRVGPKTALKLIQEKGDLEAVLAWKGWEIPNFQEIRDFFLHPPVTQEYQVKWSEPDREGIIEFLCQTHDFSEDRVSRAVEKLSQSQKKMGQSTLADWL